MTRMRIIAGIAVVGWVLAMVGNAWADDRRHGHRRDRDCREVHHHWKGHPGFHGRWHEGRGHHRGPVYRPYPVEVHRHVHRYHPRRPVVVQKEIHHHYHGRHRRNDGRYGVGVAFADPAFTFSVVFKDWH